MAPRDCPREDIFLEKAKVFHDGELASMALPAETIFSQALLQCGDALQAIVRQAVRR
jgi:hypothetical protein